MKRRAESALCCEVPQKRCVRALSKTETQLAAVRVLPAALTGQTGQRRRKRPSYPEDRESTGRILSPQKKVLSNSRPGSPDPDEDAGKLRDASSVFVQEPSVPHEVAPKRSKKETQTKPEHLTKVMHAADEGDGDLSTFNSFQFWRTPLPELDLSLMDGQSTSERNGGTSLKDPTEAMET
ncbi:uncharacterized protein wu:fa19b12 [Electrophorus electricus]|uniref:uncharacterized protein wu:fa19b12 n=1 Tax=Electrophorus electricus TaxID=8005 RepID=UPI0015D093E2|nr:uncharacterized protein wu:fa19b12 [Electrophorus electricus]